MRREKGITLVALILTVVVLLILAVVSINAIQDTQIINYTSNAGQAWNNAQREENGFLQTYNQYLGNYSGTGNSGTTTPTTVTFTIDGESYTVAQGTTWARWVAEGNGWWISYGSICTGYSEVDSDEYGTRIINGASDTDIITSKSYTTTKYPS